MSAPTVPQTIASTQANKETPIQEDMRAATWATVYAYREETSSGLVFGYHAGRWGGLSIATGTLTLTGSTTNYIVVNKTTGVISFSTATTNWNDSTNYARVYRVTTSSSAITNLYGSDFDYRAGSGGVHGGGSGAAGAVTSVNGAAGAVVLDSFDIEHTDPSGRFGSPGTIGNALEELAAAKMFEWSGMIETPEHNKTYTLCLKAPFAGTIHETTTDCASGSGTARFKIEGVNLGGTINTVTTAEQSQAHNSANVFAAGDTISFTMTSDSPSLTDFVFTVRYSRHL
jgi:hypothetical protein